MSNHLDYEINKELGECYLFMGDLEKAEEYYAKACKSNGVHPDPYIGLATVAVQKGELDKALSLYGKAYDIERNDKSLAGIALIEVERGELDAAFGHYIDALGLNPENMVAMLGIIQVGHALERIEEVIPHLNNSLALDPLKHDIRYSLAGCLFTLGRIDDAREQLEKILTNDPDNSAARELYDQIAA